MRKSTSFLLCLAMLCACSALAQGERLIKDFVSEDFPNISDLSGFRLQLFLAGQQANEYP